MSKRTVAWLLAAHAIVVWVAVPFRVDEFPLTWAPMYAVQATETPERRSVVLKDRQRLEREGWRAVHADGGEEWVRRADVNVATRNMWRLYYERTWGTAPPRSKHKNSGGATLDRWLLGIAPGAPIYVDDWQRRLLVSVNATLERAPGDADFIVALHAERVRMEFDPHTIERTGELVERIEIRWRPEWDADLAR